MKKTGRIGAKAAAIIAALVPVTAYAAEPGMIGADEHMKLALAAAVLAVVIVGSAFEKQQKN